MARTPIPLPPQASASLNVKVINTASVDWLLLEIRRGQSDRFQAIALAPNSTKDLALDSGTYRFWFFFENLSANAALTVQVSTSHAESPFPATAKTVSAPQGDRGQTSISVKV